MNNELYHFNPNHDPKTGQFSSSAIAGVSSKIYKDASKRVKGISSDVEEAARNTGSTMYGLEHRLKTKESIYRKVKKGVVEDLVAPDKAGDDIKDAVRFTTISPEQSFVSNYNKFKSEMAKKGYSESRCKNYFQLYKEGLAKHKSVQSIFKTPDGYKFEVQFQTPASQKAKDKKIPLYEEVRKTGVSKERTAEIIREMEKLAENVKDPWYIDRIKTHW